MLQKRVQIENRCRPEGRRSDIMDHLQHPLFCHRKDLVTRTRKKSFHDAKRFAEFF